MSCFGVFSTITCVNMICGLMLKCYPIFSENEVLKNRSCNAFDTPFICFCMSLSCICCENFHLLRHSIGDTCSIRWLKCHSRLIYETFLSSRRHQSKPLSTTVLARSTRKIWRTYSHSAIIGVELSDRRQTSSLGYS